MGQDGWRNDKARRGVQPVAERSAERAIGKFELVRGAKCVDPSEDRVSTRSSHLPVLVTASKSSVKQSQMSMQSQAENEHLDVIGSVGLSGLTW